MTVFLRHKIHNLLNDERFSEILTGSIWALSARVLATGLGMVTTIIIARFYGAEVLGIVSVLNSFLMLATIFTILGTNTSILRLIPEHLARYSPSSAYGVYRKSARIVICISIFTGILILTMSDFLADKVFTKPHLSFYFALTAGFVIFQSLMILNTEAIRGLRLIRLFASMHLLPSLLKLLLLLPPTFFFFHPDSPVYAMFFSIALTALIGSWVMQRAFKRIIRNDDKLHPMTAKEILTLSLPMLMTATMTFLIGQTGIIILGIFRPEAEVGYYAIAVKLASLTSFIIAAVNSMAAPRFSELFHTGKIDELIHVAQKSTKLIFWSAIPVLMFLILLGKPAILLLFGPDFTVAYRAMIFLIAGQFANCISGSTAIFMNMTGCQGVLRNIIAGAAMINVALNLLLIPRFGIDGAGMAAMASMAFLHVYILIYTKNKFGRSIGYIPLMQKW